mgnify:CR=1 FL=1
MRQHAIAQEKIKKAQKPKKLLTEKNMFNKIHISN